MDSRRLYIRGLPEEVSEADLQSRFKSFGKVAAVQVARNSIDGKCRGFAHLSMDCSEADWKKCLSTLNGSSWKGTKILIQDAKMDFETKRKAELAEADGPANKESVDKTRRRLVREASDMSLVNEKNVEGRKGWRRGKFGRAIAIVRVRKSDGSFVVMDPSHDPEALDRFYEGYHPRPVKKLSWFPSEAVNFDDISSDESVVEEDPLPRTAPVQVEIQPQEQVSKTQNWDDLASGGFSLSAALNLPVSEPVIALTAPVVSTKIPEPVVQKLDPEFNPNSLFYDFSNLFSQLPNNISTECLFMRQGSRLESVEVWKGSRSEIRKDFKKQAKAAKRLIRKKQSLHRAK